MGEFGALLKKNFIYWRRNRCGCICEIATTVVFALLFIVISRASEDKNSPERSYIEESTRIGPDPSATGSFKDI
jgi:hypothetical protein